MPKRTYQKQKFSNPKEGIGKTYNFLNHSLTFSRVDSGLYRLADGYGRILAFGMPREQFMRAIEELIIRNEYELTRKEMKCQRKRKNPKS